MSIAAFGQKFKLEKANFCSLSLSIWEKEHKNQASNHWLLCSFPCFGVIKTIFFQFDIKKNINVWTDLKKESVPVQFKVNKCDQKLKPF